mmetsp:Transcript_123413/g.217516  ORF Transcript_123413/g.217516 Transcript_123413/m.217516 type:complete len:92 (+) Transcript_123413:182-457(+)
MNCEKEVLALYVDKNPKVEDLLRKANPKSNNVFFKTAPWGRVESWAANNHPEIDTSAAKLYVEAIAKDSLNSKWNSVAQGVADLLCPLLRE